MLVGFLDWWLWGGFCPALFRRASARRTVWRWLRRGCRIISAISGGLAKAVADVDVFGDRDTRLENLGLGDRNLLRFIPGHEGGLLREDVEFLGYGERVGAAALGIEVAHFGSCPDESGSGKRVLGADDFPPGTVGFLSGECERSGVFGRANRHDEIIAIDKVAQFAAVGRGPTR